MRTRPFQRIRGVDANARNNLRIPAKPGGTVSTSDRANKRNNMDSVKTSSRSECLDAAKGICIILVVIYHTSMYFLAKCPQFADTTSFKVMQVFITGLGTMRMPLFFLISGFLANSAVFKRSWREIFQPRVATFLWLYMLWVVMDWCFRAYLISHFNPEFVHGSEAFPFTLDAFALDVVMGNTAIWYLYALVMFFTVCKLGNQHLLLTFTFMALLSLLAKQLVPQESWSLRSIASNAVFFTIGCYGKPYIEQIIERFNPLRFSIAVVGFLALGELALRNDAIDIPGVKFLISCCLVVAALDFIGLLTKHFTLNLLQTLGRYTLPIYVMHHFFIDVAAQLILPLNISSNYADAGVVTALVLLVVVNLAVCTGIYMLLNRHHGRMLFTFPKRELFRMQAPSKLAAKPAELPEKTQAK